MCWIIGRGCFGGDPERKRQAKTWGAWWAKLSSQRLKTLKESHLGIQLNLNIYDL
jgi:hypothetical protein